MLVKEEYKTWTIYIVMTVFALFFITYLPESQILIFPPPIYSNKFFHNFHLSNPVLIVPGFRQVG